MFGLVPLTILHPQITHAIDAHNYGSRDVAFTDRYMENRGANFLEVPPDVAAQTEGQFKDDLPTADSPAWVCAHCTKYACAPESSEAVTAHVHAVYVVKLSQNFRRR